MSGIVQKLQVLQTRRGNRDNLGIEFLHKNIFCGPPLEPSHRDSSNEGSQHIFSLRNKKNYLSIILNTLSYLELCSYHIWSKYLYTTTMPIIDSPTLQIWTCTLFREKDYLEDVFIKLLHGKHCRPCSEFSSDLCLHSFPRILSSSPRFSNGYSNTVKLQWLEHLKG